MLKKLKISNFAIIENVELNFEDSLTVITGETGSGKSILLGALNLLLGERADYSVIRDNTGKTVVEGVWQIDESLQPFFQENDLDYDQECIIRREVLKEGKSRAFINDSPVNLNLLKDLTRTLVHIHSQHNTLELRDKNFQLSILDLLGNHETILLNYLDIYKEYQKTNKELIHLKEQRAQTIKDRDYVNFQLEELAQLKLRENNYEELQNKLKELENGGMILENASTSIGLLDHPDGILAQLNRLKQVLGKMSIHAKSLDSLLQRVQYTEIELRDVQSELETFSENLILDPNAIDLLNERLDAYNKALRKHHLESQNDLIALQDSYLSQNQSTEELEARLMEVQTIANKLYTSMTQSAQTLTAARRTASEDVKNKLAPYLERLKLKDAKIGFAFSDKTQFDANGKDQVDLLFSTNAGVEPQPIEKIASGGELGRLMLILMTLLSERRALPTVIFDEIDTGVSGDVADRIGQLLREMGKNRQLFAITHLPQVAAAGNHHLSVRKRKIGNSTVSEVVRLNSEDKTIEIAKILSGEDVSQAAIANAKTLLSQHD